MLPHHRAREQYLPTDVTLPTGNLRLLEEELTRFCEHMCRHYYLRPEYREGTTWPRLDVIEHREYLLKHLGGLITASRIARDQGLPHLLDKLTQLRIQWSVSARVDVGIMLPLRLVGHDVRVAIGEVYNDMFRDVPGTEMSHPVLLEQRLSEIFYDLAAASLRHVTKKGH